MAICNRILLSQVNRVSHELGQLEAVRIRERIMLELERAHAQGASLDELRRILETCARRARERA